MTTLKQAIMNLNYQLEEEKIKNMEIEVELDTKVEEYKLLDEQYI